MADKKYLDETGTKELLTRIRAWVDTDKTLALKKVLFAGNSLLFYKNPDAVDKDTPEFRIDLPLIDQAKTCFVQKFTWSETEYPGSENPNVDNNPVLVLAVKGNNDTVSYSFLDMKSLLNIYKPATNTSTVTVSINADTNVISAEVNISSDVNNALSVGTDGGLFCPAVDVSGLLSQVDNLQTLYNELNARVLVLEGN